MQHFWNQSASDNVPIADCFMQWGKTIKHTVNTSVRCPDFMGVKYAGQGKPQHPHNIVNQYNMISGSPHFRGSTV